MKIAAPQHIPKPRMRYVPAIWIPTRPTESPSWIPERWLCFDDDDLNDCRSRSGMAVPQAYTMQAAYKEWLKRKRRPRWWQRLVYTFGR